jgi:hypothetical protein
MNGKKAAIVAAVGCLVVGGALFVVFAAGALVYFSKSGGGPSLSSVLPGSGSGPARVVMSADRINGLFYMQKYWIATRHLEKAVWYFAPDGHAYLNPDGVDEAALARLKPGNKGRWQAGGGKMSVAWDDGKRSEGDLEVKPDGFDWDMGIFIPVEPFESSADLVGTYEGGSSMSFGGGSTMTAKSLDVRADGTYAASGIATVSSSGATAAGESGEKGRWTLDGWQLTLRPEGAAPVTALTFPLDDESTPMKPDRMFFRGVNYAKKGPAGR